MIEMYKKLIFIENKENILTGQNCPFRRTTTFLYLRNFGFMYLSSNKIFLIQCQIMETKKLIIPTQIHRKL